MCDLNLEARGASPQPPLPRMLVLGSFMLIEAGREPNCALELDVVLLPAAMWLGFDGMPCRAVAANPLIPASSRHSPDVNGREVTSLSALHEAFRGVDHSPLLDTARSEEDRTFC